MNARYAVLAVILLVTLLTALATRDLTTRDWPDNGDAKSLKFSHSKHVKDAGMACADCHTAAPASQKAADVLRAGHDQCKSCHEEQLGSSCGTCHVNPDDIQPVQAVQRALYFSHQQHLGQKDVECATCHAGIADAALAGPEHMPPMETCVTCHNGAGATAACEACHVTMAGLVPKDHLAADFRRDHKRLTRLGSMESTCAVCHEESFCADCHEARGLLSIGVTGLMTDPAPRGSAHDGAKPMALQMVHSLNYRYTHGLDAKSRQSDCYSCHSSRDFCAECHTAGGLIDPSGVKPAWHMGAGFTTLGVGSGGGRHAEFARRDIESCVSCHDVRGGDATCIQCHSDADGIKGTDPRTHERQFVQDHGTWHSDPGSPCYSCHTDFNAHPGGARGRGFCGYCHQ